MYDVCSGGFASIDPIGYADSWGLHQFGVGLSGVDPSGYKTAPSAAECANALTKCRELRDIWASAGKTITVALFDRFLAKTGCPKSGLAAGPVPIETIAPGATAAILNNKNFLSGIGWCGSRCRNNEDFSAELLDSFDVWNDETRTGLDDIAYAVGTIKGKVSGCLTKGKCSTNGGGSGPYQWSQECCNWAGRVSFTATDAFGFPRGVWV